MNKIEERIKNNSIGTNQVRKISITGYIFRYLVWGITATGIVNEFAYKDKIVRYVIIGLVILIIIGVIIYIYRD